MTLKKALLFGLLVLALGSAYVWFFIYNKKHKNIENTKTDFTVSVIDIVKEFEDGHDSSWKKYNEKVIELSGVVHNIAPNDSISSVVFRPSENYEVYCEVYPRFNEDALKLKANDTIVVKGFFSGAEKPDDMLEISGVLRLKKCSFVEDKE